MGEQVQEEECLQILQRSTISSSGLPLPLHYHYYSTGPSGAIVYVRLIQAELLSLSDTDRWPMEAGSVVKVTLSLTKEVLDELDKSAGLSFGDRKGMRSLFVEMLLRSHFKQKAAYEPVKGLETESEE